MASINIIKHPITRIVFGIIVCLFIPYFIKEFITKPILESLIAQRVVAKSIQHLFSISILLLSYVTYYKYYEKRKISELSLINSFKEFIFGFSGGLIVISIIVFILFLLGYYEIISINSYSIFLLPLITLVLLSLHEEIIYRGIIYRITEKWIGTNRSLLITSLIFSLSHIPNKNATLLYIIGATFGGFLLGIMFTYTKRLWASLSFHFSWNFSQLFFGTSITGTNEYESFFQINLEGPKIFIGSNSGIEDSIFALIFCLLLFAIIYYKSMIKGKIIKPYWK